MSMKNSNDTIGNRSLDLPVCSAVPQPLHHRLPRSKISVNLMIAVQKTSKNILNSFNHLP
jgi:hypothetical protein